MELASPRPASIEVADDTLGAVLRPYKPHCRYLKRASIITERPELVAARGVFSIPESCYIASTGHFNAVEFNICYNQLAYTLMAACIEHKLVGALSHWDMADYRQRQLPDFLIVSFHSEFRAAMQADRFEGVVQIERVTVRRGSIFMKTSVRFDDHRGGRAQGEVMFAILNGAAAASEEKEAQYTAATA
jgi:(3R)-3-[(carboxylmethyl)amino]fatty acid synthase